MCEASQTPSQTNSVSVRKQREQIVSVNLIVFEFDVFPLNPLFQILLLFIVEHVLIEVMLKVFIRPIDAKLLKCIVVSWGRSS